jgi:hypothetical protein
MNSPPIGLIVTAEVGFWVLLATGLVARHLLGLRHERGPRVRTRWQRMPWKDRQGRPCVTRSQHEREPGCG